MKSKLLVGRLWLVYGRHTYISAGFSLGVVHGPWWLAFLRLGTYMVQVQWR